MSNKRRLCVLCKHFEADAPDHGWYPGDYEDGAIKCAQGIWKIKNSETDPAEYRKALLTAETCPQFELANDLKDPQPPLEAEEKPMTPGAKRAKMQQDHSHKGKSMKYAALMTLIFTGCILDPEPKPKPRQLYIDCRDAFDHADSTGYVYDCPVTDTMPANWPK